VGHYEIPLFPLNTVLFPGMPLQLHVFEERYRQLVAYCRSTNSPFGVVLIKNGVEANGPLAEPHLIGCTAQMAQILPLADGRYNLVAAGQDRFRIHALRHDRPYLVGEVENLLLEQGDIVSCSRAESDLRPWVERYVSLLAPGEDLFSILGRLPEEPSLLGYFAAAMLQISPTQKQVFLEFNSCPDLLNALVGVYRREVAIVQHLADYPVREQEHGFSIN